MIIGITQITVFLFLISGLVYTYIKKNKGFVTDWAPFLFLWLIYDQMRGIADNQSHINVEPVYKLEKYIFGWMFNGRIPNEWAQEHQNIYLTVFYSIVYTLHPIAPLILAIVIYYKSKDRETFKEFSNAFLLTCYLALTTFALYPVAPPWYVEKRGFQQPEKLVGVKDSAAGLLDVDNFLSISAFGDFYQRFNANPYAAVPSLHAAFSFFVAYYVIYRYRSKGKYIWLIILYPFTVWTAAVYLNHHYIVDLLAGMLYSYFSIRVVRYLQGRNRLSTSIDQSKSSKTISDPQEGNGNLVEIPKKEGIKIPVTEEIVD